MDKKMFKAALQFTGADRVSISSTGEASVKKLYFYRHGCDEDKWADHVLKTVPGLSLVATRDVYRNWPKDSYFEAIVKVHDADAVTAFVQTQCQRRGISISDACQGR